MDLSIVPPEETISHLYSTGQSPALCLSAEYSYVYLELYALAIELLPFDILLNFFSCSLLPR